MPSASAASARWAQEDGLGALWFDVSDRLTDRPPVNEEVEVDLPVVAGRFAGFWTAPPAAETEPGTRVLVEADHRASRNGVFFEDTPTREALNDLTSVACLK